MEPSSFLKLQPGRGQGSAHILPWGTRSLLCLCWQTEELAEGRRHQQPGRAALLLTPQSQNPRMVWVEGNLKDHLVLPPDLGTDTFHCPRLLQTPSSLALDTSRDGAAPASLGSLCQGLPTLPGKNFFLIFTLTLPSVSNKPFPFVLLLHALVPSPSTALLEPL